MLLPFARNLNQTSAQFAQLMCGGLLTTGLMAVLPSLGPAAAAVQVAKPKPVTVTTATVTTATVTTATVTTATVTTATKAARTFKQLMDLGYAASAQGDFHTALINFRRALAIRPNQPYAIAAAENMAYYIEYTRFSARRREIAQLESRLTNATAQQDWVCAATTLDQLTMYTNPGSLNRERLIGQRGEVSGMLDARLNYDAWSTVCSAQRPVY